MIAHFTDPQLVKPSMKIQITSMHGRIGGSIGTTTLPGDDCLQHENWSTYPRCRDHYTTVDYGLYAWIVIALRIANTPVQSTNKPSINGRSSTSNLKLSTHALCQRPLPPGAGSPGPTLAYWAHQNVYNPWGSSHPQSYGNAQDRQAHVTHQAGTGENGEKAWEKESTGFNNTDTISIGAKIS